MKIEIEKLDHVQLCIPVGEEEAGRAFYVGVLGLTEIEKPQNLRKNGGFWLQAGDIQLHIGTEPPAGKSKHHPAFAVKDLEQVYDYLVAQGVKVKQDDPIPGVSRFSFFDPWDNRIEFLKHKKS